MIELLFGRVRGRLLATLFSEPESAFYVRQLARQLKGSVGTLQRELTTLTTAGLILRTKQGNLVLYRANREHPVFAEMHTLFAKTVGIFHMLWEALLPCGKSLEFAFVYGSFAQGTETAESDVDLLVVGELTLDNLLERLAPVERKLKRPVNPTIYARKELRTKIRAGNHFIRSIQGGPSFFLVGSADEFRAIR